MEGSVKALHILGAILIIFLSNVFVTTSKVIIDNDLPSITTMYPQLMDRNEYSSVHSKVPFNSHYPHYHRRIRKLRRNFDRYGMDSVPKPFEYKYNMGSPERFHNIQDILNYSPSQTSSYTKYPDAIQFSGHYKYLKGNDFSKYMQKVQKKQHKLRLRQMQLQMQAQAQAAQQAQQVQAAQQAQAAQQQSSSFDPLFMYKPKSPYEVNLLALQRQKNREQLLNMATETSTFNKKKQVVPTKLSLTMDIFPKVHSDMGSFKPMPSSFLDSNVYYNAMKFPQIYPPAKHTPSELWKQLAPFKSMPSDIDEPKKDNQIAVHLNVFPKKDKAKASNFDILGMGAESREGKTDRFFEQPIIVEGSSTAKSVTVKELADIRDTKGRQDEKRSGRMLPEITKRKDDFVTLGPLQLEEDFKGASTTSKTFRVPIEDVITFESKDAV